MSKDIWQRDEVQSPCVNICVIHPDARLCTGCLRTIEEITQWHSLSDAARTEVIEALPARKPQLTMRRGGRAARLARKP